MCPRQLRQARSAGSSMSGASGRRGRGRARRFDWMTPVVERLGDRAQAASPRHRGGSPSRSAPVRAAGPSAAAGPDRRAASTTASTRPCASSAASIAASTAPTSVGMSPPTTRTSGARGLEKPGQQAGQRALEGDRVVDEPRRPAAGSARSPGAATTRISSTSGRTASMACLEQRPAVDRLGQLVAAEPARPAAGEDEPGDRRLGHRARPAVAIARLAGPGRGRPGSGAGSPRRSRSARIAMTYLRLVPGRVAERGRGQRRGARPSRARGRVELAVGRRGVGEVGFEHDDPAAPLELADTLRRAAGGPGGIGQRRRRGDGQGALRDDPSRPPAPDPAPTVPGRAPGERSAAPSRTSRPSVTSRSMSVAAGDRAAVRSIVASRRRVRAATARTSSRGASSPTARQDGGSAASTTSGAATRAGPAVLAVEDAVQVEPRGRSRRRDRPRRRRRPGDRPARPSGDDARRPGPARHR